MTSWRMGNHNDIICDGDLVMFVSIETRIGRVSQGVGPDVSTPLARWNPVHCGGQMCPWKMLQRP